MEIINNNEDLTLIDIMKILKKRLVFIIAITLLCTGLMSYWAMFISKPVYQASTTTVIVKGDAESAKSATYTQSDINLYKDMAKTYVLFAQSDLVIDKTAEELKVYSPGQLKSMVTVAQTQQTQMIELSVKTTDKEAAANIANVYCKNFIEQSTKILPVGKIQVLDEAKTPSGPLGAGKFKNIAVGFLFGLLASVIAVFFKYYIDKNKIKNEKQVVRMLKMPLLITIEQ